LDRYHFEINEHELIEVEESFILTFGPHEPHTASWLNWVPAVNRIFDLSRDYSVFFMPLHKKIFTAERKFL